MLVVLGILAIASLGGILSVFFSKKTSKVHKLAALIALILSGLALGVCGILFFVESGIEAQPDPFSLEQAVQSAEAPPRTNITALLIFLVVLLAFFAFIVYIFRKDRKKKMLKEAIADMKDFDSLNDF